MGEPKNLTLEMGWKLAPTVAFLSVYVWVYGSWVQKGRTSKVKMIKGSSREETWDIHVKKTNLILKMPSKIYESTLHPVVYKYKRQSLMIPK